jgi:hypothetical protein
MTDVELFGKLGCKDWKRATQAIHAIEKAPDIEMLWFNFYCAATRAIVLMPHWFGKNRQNVIIGVLF